jgi:hypothetical protein
MRKREAGNICFKDFFQPTSDTQRTISSSLLITPEFQRNYVWETSKIEALLTSISENECGYYIGSIVTIAGQQGSRSRDILVDGQQRLVTLSLCVLILSDYTKNVEYQNQLKKCLFDESFKRIQFCRENINDTYSKLLLKNESDMTGIDIDDTQFVLIKNTDYIDSRIRVLTQVQIEILIKKIVALEFVVIKCSSEDDAYQLFEGLNSTGLSLSPVDLAKNAVLGAIKKIDKSGLDIAFRSWNEMENKFEQSSIIWFGKFIRQQLYSDVGYVSDPQVFRTIKEIKIKNKTADYISGYLSSLLSESEIYISLREAQLLKDDISATMPYENWKKITEYLEMLKRLNLDQVYCILLSLIKYGKKEQRYFARGESLKVHLKKLLTYCLLAKYSGISPSSYERKFANICKEILNYDYKQFIFRMNIFFNTLAGDVRGSHDKFVKNLCLKFNYSNDTVLARYVLADYLTFAGNGLDNNVTGEHIVPENDQTKWKNISDKKIVTKYVNSIGNMTLLDEKVNSSDTFKVECFNEKYKKGYACSGFTVNKLLKKTWGKHFNSKDVVNNAILPRGEKIADKLYEYYYQILSSEQ